MGAVVATRAAAALAVCDTGVKVGLGLAPYDALGLDKKSDLFVDELCVFVEALSMGFGVLQFIAWSDQHVPVSETRRPSKQRQLVSVQ